MIDLDYAISQFHLYRNDYPNDSRTQLKTDHMLRVMSNSIDIAKKLELSSTDIKLAGLIGLLHDIGRFEQVKQFDTFIDKDSIDHAIFSSQQLFDNLLIRNFIKDSKYDYIIQKAIENHSRFEIEDGLTEEALLHSKIIRDADKIDIYLQVLSSDARLVFDGPLPDDNDTISDIVLENFKNGKCIKTQDMRNKLDDYVRKCALIYGFYFPHISLQQVYNNNYISKLKDHFLQSFPIDNPVTLQQMEEVENIANEYMSGMVNENKYNVKK